MKALEPEDAPPVALSLAVPLLAIKVCLESLSILQLSVQGHQVASLPAAPSHLFAYSLLSLLKVLTTSGQSHLLACAAGDLSLPCSNHRVETLNQ